MHDPSKTGRIRDHRVVEDPDLKRALADAGVFQVNLKGGEGFPNRFWKDWGYSAEDLQNRQFWLEIIHPDDRGRIENAYEQIMQGRRSTFVQEYRIKTAYGDWRWVLSSGSVVSWDAEGVPELYIGQDTDITYQKLTEEALREAREVAEERAEESERLRLAGAIVTSALSLEEAVDLILQQAGAVCPFDTAMVLLKEGNYLRSLGSIGGSDGSGETESLMISLDRDLPPTRVYKEEQPRFYKDLRDSFPEYRDEISQETRSWLGFPLIARAEVLGVVGIGSHSPDFFTKDHRKVMLAFADHVSIALYNAQRYDHTRTLAMTDPLTGAGTRYSFDTYAAQHLDLARRHGRHLSVMMVDLDNFKRVNDEYGHPEGDTVLRTAGRLLQEELRQSDVICRYGGDEFAVLLPETSTTEAVDIARRINARLEEAFSDAPYSISATIGIAGLDGAENESIWDLLKAADRALYGGKSAGRNRVETYNSAE